jgi:Type ISP C-terminal specificity domain
MNTAASAQLFGWQQSVARLAIYRPFDRQFQYTERKFNDRPRPNLQAAWGASNLCLYAMPAGTGAGPAVWCHALLPDYHAFRGSYGGYAFPLWDRRNGPESHNLNPLLLAGLTAAYNKKVSAQEVFDCMLCLLSAKSYTLNFAEDLEDVFPHIPFPAQHKVFLEAAELGSEIRAVETFARAPRVEFFPASLCKFMKMEALNYVKMARAGRQEFRPNYGPIPLADMNFCRAGSMAGLACRWTTHLHRNCATSVEELLN